MVGEALRLEDSILQKEANVYAAYDAIFELAASLEIAMESEEYQRMQWDCIEALIPVLEKHVRMRLVSDG
jgi:hypothetical protein